MPAAVRLRTAWPAALFALLAALFVIQATSLRGKSLTYDAPDHLRYGLQILHGDATRFDDSKMPVSAWNALPARIGEGLEPGRLRAFLEAPGTARYSTILASLALAWLVFRWSRELYGLGAAFLSLLFEVFDPTLLAHGRFVTTDLYAALTITLSLYTFWRFLRTRHWGWGVAAGLALGLAQIAKYTGAYLVPILLLIVAIRGGAAVLATLRADRRKPAAGEDGRHRARPWMGRLGRIAARTSAWGAAFALLALLVIHVGFLFQDSFTRLSDYRLRSEPFRHLQRTLAPWEGLRVPVPYPYFEGLDWVLQREQTGDGFGNIYLLGKVHKGRGFLGYYFVAFLFKVPLATQLLLLLAAVAYLVRRRRFRFLDDELVLLLPVAFFTVYFNFLYDAQMGIRYLMVAFPVLYVFAGSLVARGSWESLGRRGRRRWTAALGVLGAWLVVSVLSYYPDLLPYMNELVTDRKMSYRILADSNLDWGQDNDQIDRYLEEHPDVIWQPERPTAGRILVGINWLDGVFKRHHDRWLREHFRPVGQLHYSHLLFEVTPQDVERLKREGVVGEPPPPRRHHRPTRRTPGP